MSIHMPVNCKHVCFICLSRPLHTGIDRWKDPKVPVGEVPSMGPAVRFRANPEPWAAMWSDVDWSSLDDTVVGICL